MTGEAFLRTLYKKSTFSKISVFKAKFTICLREIPLFFAKFRYPKQIG